jgi:hypothetical protein
MGGDLEHNRTLPVQEEVGRAVERVHVGRDGGDARVRQLAHQEPATQRRLARCHVAAALEVLGQLAHVEEGRERQQVALHREGPQIASFTGCDCGRVKVRAEVLDPGQRGGVGHVGLLKHETGWW